MSNFDFNDSDGVLVLDGVFYLRAELFQKQTQLVKRTCQDLYQHLSYN